MIESKLYLLEDKDYAPILTELEGHPAFNTIKNYIAIYAVNPSWHAIVVAHPTVETIVQKSGSYHLDSFNALVIQLHKFPDQYKLVYGEAALVHFLI